MIGRQGNLDLPGSPLQADPLDLDPAQHLEGQRGRTNATWNFVLLGSWTTLGVNLPGQEMPIDSATLPGSRAARIRVRVTDSVHTTTDSSDAPFLVGSKPPLVHLVRPPSGSRFFEHDPIALVATATDLEDGPLTGPAIAWQSSLAPP
ncbi:MAG: hypothetical protein FJ387_28775 [Verrucomicrobia bacterium]|nr:hypothetical protein [Verrucomicrobiota bacterium]